MVTDHHTKYKNDENFEILWQLPKCDSETQGKQILFGKNDADRFSWCRAAKNFQFVKKCLSYKCNKHKCNKSKICLYSLFWYYYCCCLYILLCLPRVSR